MRGWGRSLGSDVGLKTKIIGLLLASSLFLLCAFGVWTYATQREATKAELVETSRVLVDEMNAVWDFISLNQDRIDYTSDGLYEYKGLHCAIVGKSVASLFSRDSEYSMRFTKIDPRNIANAPDAVETAALEMFSADPGASEYYEFSMRGDERVFRYVSAMKVTEQCMECHGGPVGEMDITGYPKEGWELGDLAGATSVTIPTALYDSNMWSAVRSNVLFFLVIVACMCIGIYVALDRLIARPIAALSSGLTRVGETGAHRVSFFDANGAYATSETTELFARFNEMSERLEILYADLELQVEERTEQLRRANEELEAQRAHVERVNERLKNENKYKSDFLAIVSHELRTPLTSVLVFAELMEESIGKDDDVARSQLEEVRKNGRILLEMVDNVLETARIQAGSERLNLELVDIADVFGQVESATSAVAARKGVRFSTCIAAGVPLVMSDWEKVRRIVSNLASNAVKFTDEGGSVDVTALLCEGGEEIAIAVRDTGIGIPEDKHRLIFERFTQENMSTVRRYGGSGLGLSLVKDLSAMLGGRVELASSPGKGSLFTVFLPVDQAWHEHEKDDKKGRGHGEGHADR
ncbi:MAG: DUF3365 domain-containing protein [Slackia sp.]|nr:DUF3365 domain-containing protein [Slackia sp.]